MKLISISDSTKPDKKLMAVFENDGRKKTVHFGAKNMDDYTLTKSKEQRERYRTRHAKDLKTGDPSRAGYLSYHILWGDSTSRAKNIAEYKKKFNL
jgi:ppGpp synthetase/RelA/SpoT-type nucleotidyltranferase